MLFTDLLKDDLVAAAKYYKVDIERDWTKEMIATALLDAGKTPEQWKKDSEAHDFGEAEKSSNGAITTDDLKGDDLPEPEDVEPEEDAEVDEEELVLVRFTGANQSFTTNGFTFSRLKPFALMTKEQFDDLDRKKFRQASKAEAAEFYNR